MKHPHDSGKSLIILWLLHSLLVLLFCSINPNHYTTIDSWYYFDYADWLQSKLTEKTRGTADGTFPPAYPLFILFIKELTGLSNLWASKMANIIAGAALFYLFHRQFSARKSIWIASILFSGPFLKLWSHSWSEPLFLALSGWWIYRVTTHRQFDITLILIGLALIFTRYAGAFIIVVGIQQSLSYRTSKKSETSMWWLFYSVVWTSSLLLLWSFNLNTFGKAWGGDRVQMPSISYLISNLDAFLAGIVNELLLFRNYTGSSLLIPFLIFSFIQAPLLYTLAASGLHLPDWHEKATANRITAIAVAYLVFLFALRCFSSFDLPGYRLLAPFSLPTLTGLVSCYFPESRKSKMLWIAIISCSWLDLLPYANALSKIRESLFP